MGYLQKFWVIRIIFQQIPFIVSSAAGRITAFPRFGMVKSSRYYTAMTVTDKTVPPKD